MSNGKQIATTETCLEIIRKIEELQPP
jgi:hypothetical protein